MKIKAAFLWDSSAKSVSYMAIDEEFSKRIPPKTKKLEKANFEQEAQKTIQSFFNSLEKIKQDNKIHIEHKIVGHGSPAHIFGKKINGPGKDTKLVKKLFLEQINGDGSFKLMKQRRSKLKGDSLKNFNKGLESLSIIKKVRGNAFEYHLWALALHATNGKYQDKLNKIQKSIMKSEKLKTAKLQLAKKKRA